MHATHVRVVDHNLARFGFPSHSERPDHRGTMFAARRQKAERGRERGAISPAFSDVRFRDRSDDRLTAGPQPLRFPQTVGGLNALAFPRLGFRPLNRSRIRTWANGRAVVGITVD